MNPRPLLISLTGALALASCATAAPVSTSPAPEPRLSFTAAIAISEADRQLQAADVTKVTVANVSAIDVYLIDNGTATNGVNYTIGALDTMKTAGTLPATILTTTVTTVAGAKVSFGNLKYGNHYALAAVAKGTNPNTGTAGILDAGGANEFKSEAQLNTPPFSGNTVQQDLSASLSAYLFAYSAANTLGAGVGQLGVKLTDTQYAGFADDVGIGVTEGTIFHDGAPATIATSAP